MTETVLPPLQPVEHEAEIARLRAALGAAEGEIACLSGIIALQESRIAPSEAATVEACEQARPLQRDAECAEREHRLSLSSSEQALAESRDRIVELEASLSVLRRASLERLPLPSMSRVRSANGIGTSPLIASSRMPFSRGRVAVTWQIERPDTQPEFRLTWTEMGGPPVSAPSRKGFGSSLIERGLPTSSVVLDCLPHGVACVLLAPLDVFQGEA